VTKSSSSPTFYSFISFALLLIKFQAFLLNLSFFPFPFRSVCVFSLLAVEERETSGSQRVRSQLPTPGFCKGLLVIILVLQNTKFLPQCIVTGSSRVKYSGPGQAQQNIFITFSGRQSNKAGYLFSYRAPNSDSQLVLSLSHSLVRSLCLSFSDKLFAGFRVVRFGSALVNITEGMLLLLQYFLL
jgi:hypothetical protein